MLPSSARRSPLHLQRNSHAGPSEGLTSKGWMPGWSNSVAGHLESDRHEERSARCGSSTTLLLLQRPLEFLAGRLAKPRCCAAPLQPGEEVPGRVVDDERWPAANMQPHLGHAWTKPCPRHAHLLPGFIPAVPATVEVDEYAVASLEHHTARTIRARRRMRSPDGLVRADEYCATPPGRASPCRAFRGRSSAKFRDSAVRLLYRGSTRNAWGATRSCLI
jgi:hypothetical protein